jgi:hypothetical protein
MLNNCSLGLQLNKQLQAKVEAGTIKIGKRKAGECRHISDAISAYFENVMRNRVIRSFATVQSGPFEEKLAKTRLPIGEIHPYLNIPVQLLADSNITHCIPILSDDVQW